MKKKDIMCGGGVDDWIMWWYKERESFHYITEGDDEVLGRDHP